MTKYELPIEILPVSLFWIMYESIYRNNMSKRSYLVIKHILKLTLNYRFL